MHISSDQTCPENLRITYIQCMKMEEFCKLWPDLGSCTAIPKTNEQMNYFPTWGEMSEPVQLSLLGILEIPSLKTCMETLNVCPIVWRHNLCWKTSRDGQSPLRLTRSKRWFPGVSTKVVFQCLCLHQPNTEHAVPNSWGSHSPTAVQLPLQQKQPQLLCPLQGLPQPWAVQKHLDRVKGICQTGKNHRTQIKPLYSKSSAVPGKWILCPPQHSPHCKVHVKFCQCTQRKQRKQEIREGEDT